MADNDERPRAVSATEVSALISSAPFEQVEDLLDRYSDDPRAQVRHAIGVARRRHDHEAAERDRVMGMYRLMRQMGGEGIVLGLDEVGRGAIAGPLTVCAVALPDDPVIWGINDSKQLTPARREVLATRIADVALAIGTAHIAPATIDALGMSRCLKQAMRLAIQDAGVEPEAVLIDGNPVHVHPKEKTLVKGDARIACVAAASIVAKVTRDELMVSLDEEYPGYHLAECKGYGSPDHIGAIRRLGLSDIHRASFCGNFLETPHLF